MLAITVAAVTANHYHVHLHSTARVSSREALRRRSRAEGRHYAGKCCQVTPCRKETRTVCSITLLARIPTIPNAGQSSSHQALIRIALTPSSTASRLGLARRMLCKTILLIFQHPHRPRQRQRQQVLRQRRPPHLPQQQPRLLVRQAQRPRQTQTNPHRLVP